MISGHIVCEKCTRDAGSTVWHWPPDCASDEEVAARLVAAHAEGDPFALANARERLADAREALSDTPVPKDGMGNRLYYPLLFLCEAVAPVLEAERMNGALPDVAWLEGQITALYHGAGYGELRAGFRRLVTAAAVAERAALNAKGENTNG